MNKEQCTDCNKMVSCWCTHYFDNKHRCESCATAKYKKDNPLLWNAQIVKNPFGVIIDPIA